MFQDGVSVMRAIIARNGTIRITSRRGLLLREYGFANNVGRCYTCLAPYEVGRRVIWCLSHLSLLQHGYPPIPQIIRSLGIYKLEPDHTTPANNVTRDFYALNTPPSRQSSEQKESIECLILGLSTLVRLMCAQFLSSYKYINESPKYDYIAVVPSTRGSLSYVVSKVANKLDIPIFPLREVLVTNLDLKMKDLDRGQRQQLVKKKYVISQSSHIRFLDQDHISQYRHKTLLLIDDMIHTGATIHYVGWLLACQFNFKQIHAACVVRYFDRQIPSMFKVTDSAEDIL